MHFLDYWKGAKPRLDDALKRQPSILWQGSSPADAVSLQSALDGGKKIRGCLVCMVSEILGGNFEAAIPRALAIEFIQAASLIHDDFVDQDTVRRNRPSMWTLEGARRAVLFGDFIFATAIKMMNDLSREDGCVVSETIAKVASGALHEPLNALSLIREIESDRFDGSLYERIIHFKTGALFGAACQLGAITARARRGVREEFYGYGVRIGEAYQIADDLHEVDKHLSAGSISRDQVAILTPTFLYFAKETMSPILEVLRGHPGSEETIRAKISGIGGLMEAEIKHRLENAVMEIGHLPVDQHKELIRTAPWELIRMIKEVE